jgi:uncharacterized membrane protein YqjE
MNLPELPILNELRAELAHLSGDLGEMLGLRRRLAAIELRAALGQIKQLAVALAVALVLGMTALPLLAVSVAWLLDGRFGLSWITWLMIVALVLLSASALVGWLAWRSFRRRFVGLEESLEELREDLVWLGELSKRTDAGGE